MLCVWPNKPMEFQFSSSDSGQRNASGYSGSQRLKRAQAKEREPVGMVLAGHQLGRIFTDLRRNPAALKASMVQEKLKQVRIRAAEPAAQREVVAQPRVQVLDQSGRRAGFPAPCVLAGCGEDRPLRAVSSRRRRNRTSHCPARSPWPASAIV